VSQQLKPAAEYAVLWRIFVATAPSISHASHVLAACLFYAARLAGPRCIAALASGLRLSGCGVSSAGSAAGAAAAAAAGLQELLLEEVDDLSEQVGAENTTWLHKAAL
jgi:hypothetical protein